MPTARCNGIDICYESMGSGPPLLLIMGIGTQLVYWPDALCQLLVEQGLRVIRLDNRDAGLSSHLDHLGVPRTRKLLLRVLMRRRVNAPYTLWDMALDTVGLLDALELPAAHLVGMSMGGMIAQCAAISHPERALSLTSISSTTGDRRVSWGKPRAMWALHRPAPRGGQAAIEHEIRLLRTIGSPELAADEEDIRRLVTRAQQRAYDPAGTARQFAAILASGNRTRKLRQLDLPTLVIHGTQDPLIPFAAGQATAAAIPEARLLPIAGMGHDLPPAAWSPIVEAIAAHVHGGSTAPPSPL